MLLERFVCGRARSNAYVYAPGPGRDCVVVDPGVGACPRITDLVRAEGLEPRAVLLTHGHPDHIWHVRRFTQDHEVPTYLHSADLGWFVDPASGGHLPLVRLGGRLVGRARRLAPRTLLPVDGPVDAGPITIEVRHTPGHTRGSVCLRLAELAFTGDTVFRGGLGQTAYPGGSRSMLRDSVSTELLGWPDDLRLLPGHGAATSVGAERERWEAFVGRG